MCDHRCFEGQCRRGPAAPVKAVGTCTARALMPPDAPAMGCAGAAAIPKANGECAIACPAVGPRDTHNRLGPGSEAQGRGGGGGMAGEEWVSSGLSGVL